jgi:hypothetical protein
MRSVVANGLVWGWAFALGLMTLAFIFYDPGDAAVFVAPALMAVAMGALIVTRVRGNAIGSAMLIGGSAWLLYAVGRDYAILSIEIGPLPGEYIAAWLGASAGPLFYLSFPTLLLLFPDGRVRGARRWPMLVVAGLVLLTVAGAAAVWGLDVEVLVDDAAVTVDPRYQLTDLAFLLSLWMTIPATFVIVKRFRNGAPVVRQQVKWLLFGSLALAGSLSFAPFLDDSDLWGIALAVGMSLFPIGIAIAVFKYRLYDLGRVVSRTVSYAIVVVALGAVFVVGVVLIPNRLLGVQDPPAVLVAGSTLAAAALFNPIRKAARGWIDRRFNRSHYDAGQVMDRFAGSLQERVDREDVIDGWIDVVEVTMQPEAMGVWVRAEGT